MNKAIWCMLLCAAGLATLAGTAFGQNREDRDRKVADNPPRADREQPAPRERSLEAQVRELTEQVSALREAVARLSRQDGRPQAGAAVGERERREAAPPREQQREASGNVQDRMRERRMQEERAIGQRPPGGPMAQRGAFGFRGGRDGADRPQAQAGRWAPWAGRDGAYQRPEGMSRWGQGFAGRAPFGERGQAMRQGEFGRYSERPGFEARGHEQFGMGPQARFGGTDSAVQARQLLNMAMTLITRAEQMLDQSGQHGPRGSMAEGRFGHRYGHARMGEGRFGHFGARDWDQERPGMMPHR